MSEPEHIGAVIPRVFVGIAKRSGMNAETEKFVRKCAELFPGLEVEVNGKWHRVRTEAEVKAS